MVGGDEMFLGQPCPPDKFGLDAIAAYGCHAEVFPVCGLSGAVTVDVQGDAACGDGFLVLLQQADELFKLSAIVPPGNVEHVFLLHKAEDVETVCLLCPCRGEA